MSSDESAENSEDPEQVSFIRMAAEDTFEGHERVLSRAAYDFQCRATSHSAFCGHPGFVPDEYLAALSIEATPTPAELCTAGMWERIGDGDRMLGWEAVQVCVDHVRELRATDNRAPAREPEHHAREDGVAHASRGYSASEVTVTGRTRFGGNSCKPPPQASGVPPAVRWLAW